MTNIKKKGNGKCKRGLGQATWEIQRSHITFLQMTLKPIRCMIASAWRLLSAWKQICINHGTVRNKVSGQHCVMAQRTCTHSCMQTSVCEEHNFNICTVKTKVMAFNGRELKELIRAKKLLTTKQRTYNKTTWDVSQVLHFI